MAEFDDLYALDAARAVERLRVATHQELRELHTLAGSNQDRANELELYLLTVRRAGVHLIGPELPRIRLWLEAAEDEYQQAVGAVTAPMTAAPLPNEDHLVAELRAVAGDTMQVNGRVRTLITASGDVMDGSVRPVGRPPSVVADDLEEPIELEVEEDIPWPGWDAPPAVGGNGAGHG